MRLSADGPTGQGKHRQQCLAGQGSKSLASRQAGHGDYMYTFLFTSPSTLYEKKPPVMTPKSFGYTQSFSSIIQEEGGNDA